MSRADLAAVREPPEVARGAGASRDAVALARPPAFTAVRAVCWLLVLPAIDPPTLDLDHDREHHRSTPCLFVQELLEHVVHPGLDHCYVGGR